MNNDRNKLKPKVLFVLYNDFNRGGVQSVLIDVAKELNAEYTFDALCFDHTDGDLETQFVSYGGEIIKTSVYYEGKSIFRQRADFYLRPFKIVHAVEQVIQEHGPYQVVHCHNEIEAGLCLYAARKCRIPIRIAHSHIIYKGEFNALRRIYNALYIKMIHKNATNMVGCSRAAADSLFGENNGIVIFNGIDTSKFNPDRYDKNLHSDEIILLQVATYSENKNQLFSLKVLRELKKTISNVKLYFVGRTDLQIYIDYLDQMKQFISENHLIDSVQFFPGESDVPEIMSKCNYLLMPSILEGFGIVPLEAQSMGLKCFTSEAVPKEVNCGGCVRIPLELGADYWASVIDDDYKGTQGKHMKYDCRMFSFKCVADEYRRNYEIGSDL